MQQFLIFISLAFFNYACNNINDKTLKTSSSDSTLPIIVDTSKKHSNDNGEGKITVQYHLTFDSSKMLMGNLDSGWLDTFTIDKQNFRLRVDTTATDYERYCIEQLKKGTWQKLFNLFLCSDEYGKEDINNDGYLDFIAFYHARHYIYFYKPKRKTLSDTICVMPEDYTVIDKQNFIMYNHYEPMYSNPYESSQLYTYKGTAPYFYYELLLVDNDGNNFKKMNLYKYKNGNSDDTVFVRTISSGTDIKFNYKTYWTKHYKEIMGYN